MAMSCRSTACGSAVSSVTTALSGCSAGRASELFHALRAQYREAGLTGAASRDDVVGLLERFSLQVRHAPGLSESRRARVLGALDEAVFSVMSGDEVPDVSAVAAWRDMPAAAGERGNRGGPGSRPYHVRFSRFDRRTLAATDVLFAARPSRLSAVERSTVFEGWVEDVSDVYGMERPGVVWDVSADGGGGGFYSPASHVMTLSPNRPSVTTLLHEFRHALQHTGKGARLVSRDVEVDARAWSLSLFYQVRPRLFERLVREGRILHVDASVFD